MKVLLVGSTKYTRTIWVGVSEHPGTQICGLITNEKQFSISYSQNSVFNYRHENMKRLAEEANVPGYVMTESMLEPGLVEFVEKIQPEIMIVAGWYHMMPKRLRDCCLCLGLHASLLPKYAGGAPLVWALVNGERETGVTLFKLEKDVDVGDIYLQRKILIEHEDDIASLYSKVEKQSQTLIGEFFDLFPQGKIRPIPQNMSERTEVPQRSPEDGHINWGGARQEIYNFVRAQTRPYPGAFAVLGDQMVKVWRVSPVEFDVGRSSRLGEVKVMGSNQCVKCSDGWVWLEDYNFDLDTKRRLADGEILN